MLAERNSKKMINKPDNLETAPPAHAARRRSTAQDLKSDDSITSLENDAPKGVKGVCDVDTLAKAIHEIDLNLEPKITPSFYYYKRWLWIAFPWLCLQPDKRYNYSALIYECYSSSLKYLSVGDDLLLTERKRSSSRLNQDREG